MSAGPISAGPMSGGPMTFDEEQSSMATAAAQVFAACGPQHGGTSARPWLRELGLALMVVPEAAGGLGLTEIDASLVLEELGFAALPVAAAETVGLVAPLLVRHGTEQQRERWLPALEAGAWGGAVCPWSGPPELAAKEPLLVEREGRVFVVKHAAWSSAGVAALTGAARLGPDAAPEMRARGEWVAASVLNGISRRLLEFGLEHARVREQFSVPIGTFQAVRHMLADVATALEPARASGWRAAAALAHEDVDAAVSCRVAKTVATRAAALANAHVLQVHGGIGFTREHPVHAWLTAGHEMEARWGDAAVHERELGRYALGVPDLIATLD